MPLSSARALRSRSWMLLTLLTMACSDEASSPASAAGASGSGQGGTSAGSAGSAGSDGGSAGSPPGPLFANLSFESVDENGAPQGWSCICAQDTASGPCQTEETPEAPDGTRVLVLGPGCSAFADNTRAVLPSASVPLQIKGDATALGSGQGFLYGFRSDDEPLDTEVLAPSTNGQGIWSTMATNRAINTDGLTRMRIVLSNGAKTGNARFDDLRALDDQKAVPAKTATLLAADSYMEINVAKGSEEAQLWAPLPLDYATQTPLYLEFSVEPPGTASQIDYRMDGSTNWGAVVHFAPGTAAKKVTISWKAVVLTRALHASERSAVYAATDDPSTWLTATPDANFDDPAVSTVAATLASPQSSPRDRMLSVIGWTSSNIRGEKFTRLDATAAISGKAGSCTGFANAASALGRSVGVPTRALANILVGMPQQVHSINEFYLGPELGWRRVEPQSPLPSVEEDGYLALRLVLPSDESDLSFSPPADLASWFIPGVPLRTLNHPLAGGARISLNYLTKHFPTCKECINGASVQATLHGDEAQVKTAFAQARTAWSKDLPAYLAGGLASDRMTARRTALLATSLADVQALLASLP